MNNKGQAVIETVIISFLAVFFALKLIQLGLHMRYEIILDDLIEETLICKYEDSSSCINDLRKKLTELHFKEIQIIDRSGSNYAQVSVSARTDSTTTVSRESRLSLDLSVN